MLHNSIGIINKLVISFFTRFGLPYMDPFFGSIQQFSVKKINKMPFRNWRCLICICIDQIPLLHLNITFTQTSFVCNKVKQLHVSVLCVKLLIPAIGIYLLQTSANMNSYTRLLTSFPSNNIDILFKPPITLPDVSPCITGSLGQMI